MKPIAIIISIISISLFSCNGVKQEAKDAINKSGEIIGESSSEFIDGVSKGIDKKFKCEFELDSAKFSGIETGKYEILESVGADDNILSLYLIFNKSVSDSAIVKVYDQENLEYGRAKVFISGVKDDAHYIDIQFDDRVSLESISKFTFE